MPKSISMAYRLYPILRFYNDIYFKVKFWNITFVHGTKILILLLYRKNFTPKIHYYRVSKSAKNSIRPGDGRRREYEIFGPSIYKKINLKSNLCNYYLLSQ